MREPGALIPKPEIMNDWPLNGLGVNGYSTSGDVAVL